MYSDRARKGWRELTRAYKIFAIMAHIHYKIIYKSYKATYYALTLSKVISVFPVPV